LARSLPLVAIGDHHAQEFLGHGDGGGVVEEFVGATASKGILKPQSPVNFEVIALPRAFLSVVFRKVIRLKTGVNVNLLFLAGLLDTISLPSVTFDTNVASDVCYAFAKESKFSNPRIRGP